MGYALSLSYKTNQSVIGKFNDFAKIDSVIFGKAAWISVAAVV
jgi:hypothetical protein